MKNTTWQERIMYMAVIYSMLEQKKTFSTLLEGDEAFLEPVLDEMFKRELVSIDDKNNYVVTPRALDLRRLMVGMYDQLMKFEIFGSVNQGLALTGEQAVTDDPNAVWDNILDPRFVDVPGTSEDLRLAMLDWLNTAMKDELKGQQVDPYQVVFLQKLRAGEYKKDLWYELRSGEVFTKIERIVSSAVKWRDMGNTEDEAFAAMNAIYTAGMIEQRKRDGERCTCGAYLAMYEYWAQKEGKTLSMCPCCQGSFDPIAPPGQQAGQACPQCGTDIFPRQRKCKGCGAHIDRSMSAGSVETDATTTYTTENVAAPYYWPWGSYASYGYVPPIVYYDPFNPVVDAFAFGLMCGFLL